MLSELSAFYQKCNCWVTGADALPPPYRPSVKINPYTPLKLRSPDQILNELQSEYVYLAMGSHYLHDGVKTVEAFIAEGDENRARDALQRLEVEVEQEEESLASAFSLFVRQGQDSLHEAEVKTMLVYLGFPSSAKDIDDLLKAVDADDDRELTLSEFQRYVGKMGGTQKLFETRQRTIMKKDSTDSVARRESELHAIKNINADMQSSLIMSGIDKQAQAYWRVIVPESEFNEVRRLVACQKSAIRHIRTLAKRNHEAALPKLQMRCRQLNYTEEDLWMALSWIREMAPIIIHLDLTKMMDAMERDTHYRNQFETKKSGGLLNERVRLRWEEDLFGGAYSGCQEWHRCKYGVMNVMNDYRGVTRCAQYGDSYLVLKNVRLRCTFSPEDSANLKAESLAVLDYYAHVLAEYSDEELKETMSVALAKDEARVADGSVVGKMHYKEAQIHGPVSFDKHIDRLVAHERHRGWFGGDKKRLEKICNKHGWKFSWRDEEKNRMAQEVTHKLDESSWKGKLRNLRMAVPDSEGVAPGRCRKGCGREVAKGVDKNGNPLTTCCRGCACGFGHDMSCGKGSHFDSNELSRMVDSGLCIIGCGRPKAKGVTVTGRPYEKCCISCRPGQEIHDSFCGSDHYAIQYAVKRRNLNARGMRKTEWL